MFERGGAAVEIYKRSNIVQTQRTAKENNAESGKKRLDCGVGSLCASTDEDGCYFRVSRGYSHGRPTRPAVLLLAFLADSQCPPWRGRTMGDGCEKQGARGATNGGGRDWRLGCRGKTRSHSLIEPVQAPS